MRSDRKAATPAARPKRLPVKKLLLVLGAVATIYAAVLLIWGGASVVRGDSAPLGVLWSWTGLEAAGLCLLNYVLRGLRWRSWMAHYDRRFGLIEGLRLYLAGYAFTPTPGNVGEAVRGLMLKKEPLRTAQSLAIFGAERLADLFCLLLLCLPAGVWFIGFLGGAAWLANLSGHMLAMSLAIATTVAATAAVLFVLLMVRRNWGGLRRRMPWLHEAWLCLTIKPGVWFGLTLSAWAAQGLAMWLLSRDLGLLLALPDAIGFYALAMVAGALSALPAGLGGMEAVLTALLLAQGATGPVAVTITVLTRLLTLWLAVSIGLAALFYSAAIKKDISFS